MTNLNHVSAQDISAKWSKVTHTEAASIKSTDSLSAQVQKSYGFDKAKADAEVKQFMGAVRDPTETSHTRRRGN